MLFDFIFGERRIMRVGVVGLATFEYYECGEPQAYSLKIHQSLSVRRWGYFEQLSAPYVDIPPELQTIHGTIHYDSYTAHYKKGQKQCVL